jgi:hypothetical protein
MHLGQADNFPRHPHLDRVVPCRPWWTMGWPTCRLRPGCREGNPLNLLSAVLPGLREFRTPLATGLLWALGILIAWSPDGVLLGSAPPSVRGLLDLSSNLPDPYLTGAGFFAAYLVGAVTPGLSEVFGKYACSPFLRLIDWLLRSYDQWRFTRKMARKGFEGGMYRESWSALHHDLDVEGPSVRGPILDAVAAAYGKVGAPSSASFALPVEPFVERLEVTALQLWSVQPTQYQEFDRLGAEANFRTGIALPLGFVGFLIAMRTSWLVLIPVAIAVLVLTRQALACTRRKRELIANALSLGLVESTLLVGVMDGLKELGLMKEDGVPRWHAATMVALSRRGEYDVETEVIHGAVARFSGDDLKEILDYLTMMGEKESVVLLAQLTSEAAGGGAGR